MACNDQPPFKIPIRNKHKEVVGHAVVDGDVFAEYGSRPWHMLTVNSKTYASCSQGLMHNMIMGETPLKHVVDHINGDGLDNRKSNLRFATRSLNSQSKVKRKGASSSYYGVSASPYGWGANLCGKGLGYYKEETHAAYAYDLAVLERYDGEGRINGIPKPSGWEPAIILRQNCDMPRGVKLKKGRFEANYWNKDTKKYEYLGTFDTKEAASTAYEEKRRLHEEKMMIAHNSKEITREDGVAYVVAGSRKVWVSDEDWHMLSLHKWNENVYPMAMIDRTPNRMHVFIMGKREGSMIDHINGDKYDNRRCNLRFATSGQNNHNRTPGSKLGYKGVSRSGRRYYANISCSKVKYPLGGHDTAELAAYAYDMAAVMLFGDHARINGVEAPEGWTWNKNTMRLDPDVP